MKSWLGFKDFGCRKSSDKLRDSALGNSFSSAQPKANVANAAKSHHAIEPSHSFIHPDMNGSGNLLQVIKRCFGEEEWRCLKRKAVCTQALGEVESVLDPRH